MHGSNRKDRPSVQLAIHLYDGTNIRQHNNRKVGVGSRQGRHTPCEEGDWQPGRDLDSVRWRSVPGQCVKRDARFEFSGAQVTLHATDEHVAWIVFSKDLEMSVKAVTVHLHMEPASLTLGTDLYLSAIDSLSRGKNCVVRDQSVSFPNP
jgi:hypothetical protein